MKLQRIALGMTQEELAELMGTTATTIRRWENPGLGKNARAINEGWLKLAFEVAATRKKRPKTAASTDGRRGPRTR